MFPKRLQKRIRAARQTKKILPEGGGEGNLRFPLDKYLSWMTLFVPMFLFVLFCSLCSVRFGFLPLLIAHRPKPSKTAPFSPERRTRLRSQPLLNLLTNFAAELKRTELRANGPDA
jgi:hypothetical protein